MEQQHQPVTQTKYGIVAPTRNPNQTELLGMEQHLPVSQTKPNNFIQHVLGRWFEREGYKLEFHVEEQGYMVFGVKLCYLPELNVVIFVVLNTLHQAL